MPLRLSTGRALRTCLRIRSLLGKPAPYIFLATMPKSASTFLHRALVQLTGFESAYFASAYYNIEQELYRPYLIDYFDVPCVTQQHTRPNRINIDLFREFGIRPIVLVRDIPDVLVSMRDHILNERPDNLPGLHVPAEFESLNAKRQLEFVVAGMGPWLISFYAAWDEVRRSGELETHWLHFRDVVADWPAALKVVTDFHGIHHSDAECQAAVESLRKREQSQLRINKGVSGRGTDEISAASIAELERYAACFPATDFTPVGIGRA